MEEALRDYLLTQPALVALVGQKIRWVVSSQSDAGSRIVLAKVSSVPAYHTAGQSDLADSRVQVDCYAETALTALSIARAVKAAIPKAPFTTISDYIAAMNALLLEDGLSILQEDGFSILLETAGSIDFSLFQLSERQSYEDPTPSHRVHRVSIDFQVWHTSP